MYFGGEDVRGRGRDQDQRNPRLWLYWFRFSLIRGCMDFRALEGGAMQSCVLVRLPSCQAACLATALPMRAYKSYSSSKWCVQPTACKTENYMGRITPYSE